jgi:hypothetical protein
MITSAFSTRRQLTLKCEIREIWKNVKTNDHERELQGREREKNNSKASNVQSNKKINEKSLTQVH